MQTSYSFDMPKALEGQRAEAEFGHVVTKENLTEAIPFGRFVSRGTTDHSCRLPSASGDVTDGTKALGVALAHQAIESSATGDPQYPQNSAVNVLATGRVWVKVEEAVVPTDPVYVRFAAGAGGSQKGAFRKSADAGTAAQLSGAKYVTSAASGGLALLELDL